MQIATQSIVILISGGGSNMAAIVRASQKEGWTQRYGAQVACVISNQSGAGGLSWAREQGIPTEVVDHHKYANRGEFDLALASVISRHDLPGRPALVVLAGFMRILTPDFVTQHAGRLLNIHPSLLPVFAGLHTHRRAIAAGCKFAGATVHQVTAELDAGAILEQSVVPVLPSDTEQSLAARVLATEHLIYPHAIRAWLLASTRLPVGTA
jgi:phosphoribosylglycinamide formyltransferase-1